MTAPDDKILPFSSTTELNKLRLKTSYEQLQIQALDLQKRFPAFLSDQKTPLALTFKDFIDQLNLAAKELK